jgi:hypothetical protein
MRAGAGALLNGGAAVGTLASRMTSTRAIRIRITYPASYGTASLAPICAPRHNGPARLNATE